MVGPTKITVSRRNLLKAAGAAAAVTPSIVPKRGRAQPNTLKIMEWKHFVPSYNQWFKETYIKEWGGEKRHRGHPRPHWNGRNQWPRSG
jgi:hypothetical protein